MSSPKTGKYGHARVHLVAADIFTSKKDEGLSPLLTTWTSPTLLAGGYCRPESQPRQQFAQERRADLEELESSLYSHFLTTWASLRHRTSTSEFAQHL
ncbi:unnamed protein product [Fusarium langsethiae]|nr:unnamed protein product [Fusarium langsethiae]